MMVEQFIFSENPPWVFKTSFISKYADLKGVFSLNGAKMRYLDEFYRELEEVLKFPDYFGRNFNALSEILTDLSWLQHEDIILFIFNGNEVLSKEDGTVLSAFIELLEEVGQEWATPVALGEAWDRRAVAFKAVFEIQEDNKNPTFNELCSI